ncbi:carbohydrate porin [Labrenzia sp. PHM005]|nr:carbohydrate porin [Labrenzia sp. PHM005]
MNVGGRHPALTRRLCVGFLVLVFGSAQAQDHGSGGLGGPSSVQSDLSDGDGLTDPQFRSRFPEPLLPHWFAFKETLKTNANIDFKIDYLSLGQWSNSNIGQGHAVGGMARIYGTWQAFENGGLTAKLEHRTAYTSVAPQFFGFDSGAQSITGTAFNDIQLALTNLFWTQRAEGGAWVLQAGQLDVTDFVDVYGLVSPYTAFQNLAFNTNPTINAPNQGLGIAGGVRLHKNIYAIASVADANGDPTQPNLNVFNKRETFKSFELGFMSGQDRIYFDNIHLTVWQSDGADDGSRKDDWGISGSAAWFFDNRWMPFLRAGISQGKAALYKKTISAGLGLYTRETDLFGIGLNWSDPGDAFDEDQYTAEIFYRFIVSPHLAITPSLQLIANPALNPDQENLAIFGLRGRIAL